MILRRGGLFFVLIGVLALTAAADSALPFGVTLGGQKAVLEKPSAAFARIAKAVAADAEIVADSKEAMIIINIFDSDAQGNVASSAVPAIVILQGVNKGKISQVMSGKAPKAGHHLMNITAGAATARVFFTIQ
jgi:hypothetical protein